MSRLRFVEAEPLLLRFARETGDSFDQCIAIGGLCEMLCTSDEAREFIRDIVDRGAFDESIRELEDAAIPLGIITEKPFAEAPAWQERLKDASLRPIAPLLPSRFDDDGDDEPDDEPDDEFYDSEFDRALDELIEYDERTIDDGDRRAPEVVRPIVAPPKVGRNDPCPCGSGKKFKKCCQR